ncbi:MAG: hypothetical protein FJ038_13810, partial [Chloroflexi bacterium]|nr:hypothetical protein [Chloroflexota bacterium]
LGLYLSDHPLEALAGQLKDYVSAYSTDLRDESLDGQRIVIGGVVTGTRTVVTKSKQTMAVATLEDLTGSIEVIVFPRLYEQTAGTWQEGAILIVAGRVDHKGEETPLLADLAIAWEDALARGPAQVAREIAAGDRGRGGRRPSNGHANGQGAGLNGSAVPPVPGPPAREPVVIVPSPELLHAVAGAPVFVSPLRAGAAPNPVTPAIGPPEPVSTDHEPPTATLVSPDRDEEPPLPDEARAHAAEADAAPTPPTSAGPASELHVRFRPTAGFDLTVAAMEAFKVLIRERPGSTPVYVHLTAETMPMRLRGVAYDAELLAEVRRRLGEGLVELHLS